MSDIDRRDWLVRSHVESAKAAGASVNVEDVTRQAARDLAAADKLQAKRRQVARRPDEAKPDARAKAKLDAAAQKRKSSLYERPAASDGVMLPKLTGVDEERRIALFARIKRICTPIPERLKPSELANGIGGMCEYPALANDVALHTYGYARGSTIHPSTGITSYRGLSFDDKIRKYTRALEDICDRSTALLGPWWVK